MFYMQKQLPGCVLQKKRKSIFQVIWLCNYGFGHIYWRNPQWKTSFFVLRVFLFEHLLYWASPIHWLSKADLNFKFATGKNMFKVDNRNTKIRCEICWKLTMSINLTLTIFHILFSYFYCWLRAGKRWLV